MNLYLTVLILTGLFAVAAYLYALHLRECLSKLTHQNNLLRWRTVHQRQAAYALKMVCDKLRTQRDDDWAVVERMMEQMAHDERRMAYLDERRYSILIRWWRRAKYRHLAGRLIARDPKDFGRRAG